MVNGAGLQLSLHSSLLLTMSGNSTHAELTDFGRKVRGIHEVLQRWSIKHVLRSPLITSEMP